VAVAGVAGGTAEGEAAGAMHAARKEGMHRARVAEGRLHQPRDPIDRSHHLPHARRLGCHGRYFLCYVRLKPHNPALENQENKARQSAASP
jgi:hypothetical protein